MSIQGRLNIERELMTIGSFDTKPHWSEKPDTRIPDESGTTPWRSEPFDFGVWTDEKTGLLCMIKRHSHGGGWCGYVFVDPSHPVNQRTADEDGVEGDLSWGNPTYLEVHGGITWHGEMSCSDIETPGVAVGFDCNHLHDRSPAEPSRRYDGAGNVIGIIFGEYRTALYVIAEVRSLAVQIHEYRPLQQMVG